MVAFIRGWRKHSLPPQVTPGALVGISRAAKACSHKAGAPQRQPGSPSSSLEGGWAGSLGRPSTAAGCGEGFELHRNDLEKAPVLGETLALGSHRGVPLTHDLPSR